MKTSEYHPLSKLSFEQLAAKRSLHSVTIYLPLHKTGKEQNENLAQANLKSCLKEVHKALAQYQMQEDEINLYLKPIRDLIANIDLWRNPSDGLAIFLNKEGLNYYSFPINFDTRSYVSDHFYLKPLLPMYHGDGTYYLLELSEDYVKFYECSRYGCKDLFLEDVAPKQLEEAVGFDFKSKTLQFRSGQEGHGAGSFHGHGEGKDDHQEEMIHFFREIDKGVKRLVRDTKAPLLLACSEPLFGIYKEVNTHPHLYDKRLSGDPEFKNKSMMHQESWELMQDHFEKTKYEKMDLFTELYHTPKISSQPSEIIPAAFNGKIDTLFLKKGAELYGKYVKEGNHVLFEKEKKMTNASLLNLAAIQTFIKNGNVFELDPKEMPIMEQPMNAIFRY